MIYHEADSSLIHKNIEFEIYCKNKGLIYKESIHLNSQEIIPDIKLEDRITTGKIYKQTYKEQ